MKAPPGEFEIELAMGRWDLFHILRCNFYKGKYIYNNQSGMDGVQIVYYFWNTLEKGKKKFPTALQVG